MAMSLFPMSFHLSNISSDREGAGGGAGDCCARDSLLSALLFALSPEAIAVKMSTADGRKIRIRFMRPSLLSLFAPETHGSRISQTFLGWRAAQFRSYASTPPFVRNGRRRARRRIRPSAG